MYLYLYAAYTLLLDQAFEWSCDVNQRVCGMYLCINCVYSSVEFATNYNKHQIFSTLFS